MPIFAELGITRDTHVAISHPPDGNPLIGPAPGARNFWCCCGTQIGIGWRAGAGPRVGGMVHGAADISMCDYDPRRFGSYANTEWQVVTAKEDYCLRHVIPVPHFNRSAGGAIKPSPRHEILKAKSAVFEEAMVSSAHAGFAKSGAPQPDHHSFRQTVVDDVVAADVRAVREGAGIMDVTTFTKVQVEGRDAHALLDLLTANRMPQKGGNHAYSYAEP